MLADTLSVTQASGLKFDVRLLQDTFFDDMRAGASAIRYSRPIIEWAASQKPPRGVLQPGGVHYQQKNMEKFLFEDLNIRVGAEYLYCHQVSILGFRF
jgi:hypothetical protein